MKKILKIKKEDLFLSKNYKLNLAFFDFTNDKKECKYIDKLYRFFRMKNTYRFSFNNDLRIGKLLLLNGGMKDYEELYFYDALPEDQLYFSDYVILRLTKKIDKFIDLPYYSNKLFTEEELNKLFKNYIFTSNPFLDFIKKEFPSLFLKYINLSKRLSSYSNRDEYDYASIHIMSNKGRYDGTERSIKHEIELEVDFSKVFDSKTFAFNLNRNKTFYDGNLKINAHVPVKFMYEVKADENIKFTFKIGEPVFHRSYNRIENDKYLIYYQTAYEKIFLPELEKTFDKIFRTAFYKYNNIFCSKFENRPRSLKVRKVDELNFDIEGISINKNPSFPLILKLFKEILHYKKLYFSSLDEIETLINKED